MESGSLALIKLHQNSSSALFCSTPEAICSLPSADIVCTDVRTCIHMHPSVCTRVLCNGNELLFHSSLMTTTKSIP